MLQRLVLIFSILSVSVCSFAITVESFKVPWLEVMPAGLLETKPTNRGPLRLIFNNTPKGKMIRANPPECSALELEREMDSNKKDARSLSVALQSFLSRCEDALKQFPKQKLAAMLKLAEGNYPLEGRENLREVILHLPYKTTIHGLLALKDLTLPRPMVIVICGSACNLSDSNARFFLTQFFDTMPFNLLVLPSLSGSDFIKDNRGFGLGGFEEGRQAFEVVRLLGGPDSPFRTLISSFHILGTSLGGNGALFTSAYGSYNNQYLSGPKINSVIGYCPVVDLKASLMDLDRDDPTGHYFTGLIGDAVIKNFAYVFGSNHDMPTLYKPGHNQSVPFIEKYIYPRYKILSKIQDFQLAPLAQVDLDTPESFWKANNFLNYYAQVTVPTLLMYSEDDFIVSPKVNSIALEEALKKVPNPLVNVVHVEKGAHCAASEIYGEDIINGAIEKYILTESPEFDFTSRERSFNFSEVKGLEKIKLQPDQKFFGYEFESKKGSDIVTMNLKVWDPNHKPLSEYDCSRWNPYDAFEGCFSGFEFKFPLAMFFPNIVGKVPSKEQAEELTRWLNRRVHVLTATGQEPVDTTDFPSVAKWTID